MINRIIKIIIPLIALSLLTTFTWAEECAIGDSNCALAKKQAEALKQIGIKPLQPTPLTLTPNDQKSAPKQETTITPVKPFVIPVPESTEEKSGNTSSPTNTTLTTQGSNDESINTKNESGAATTPSGSKPINIYK